MARRLLLEGEPDLAMAKRWNDGMMVPGQEKTTEDTKDTEGRWKDRIKQFQRPALCPRWFNRDNPRTSRLCLFVTALSGKEHTMPMPQ
jgi:hypothetical protein